MRHTARSTVIGHVPPKLVITTPWKALYVDLIGPYTLNDKDGSSIDFISLMMIVPATSWLILKLPTVKRPMSPLRERTKQQQTKTTLGKQK